MKPRKVGLRRTTFTAIAVLLLGLVAGRSRANDNNGNGFEDEHEIALAAKFCPSLVLEAGDNHVAPEPVEIMGKVWGSALRYWDSWFDGEQVTTWTDQDYSFLDSWEDFRYATWGLKSGDFGCGTDEPICFFWHWDYAGTGGTMLHTCGQLLSGASYDQPGGWYDAYQNGRPAKGLLPGTDYPHTTYAHLFKVGDEYVIQYWFFYPFDDWINNHEGDWEHVNVVVTSDNPAGAQLDRVVYYFHQKYITRAINQLENPNNYGYQVVDDTHPIIFVGGYGTETFDGITGSGYGSHGSYPARGTWPNVEVIEPAGIDLMHLDDEVHGDGDYVDWRQFVFNSCLGDRYGLVLIRDPETYNFAGADRAMSWLGAKIFWGYPWVHSFQTHNDAVNLLSGAPHKLGNWAPMGPPQQATWHVVESNTEDFGYYTENNPPVASDQPFTPPAPTSAPTGAMSMFESQASNEPLHDFADIGGSTCLAGTLTLEWGVGSSPTEWFDDGVTMFSTYVPLDGTTYARWNTGIAPTGTYTLRARVDLGGGTFVEQSRTVTVEHRSTVVSVTPPGTFTSVQAAIAWAEAGDTVYVSEGESVAGNVQMKASVNLVGRGMGATLVGQGTGPTVDLNAASYYGPCLIKGLTLTRQGAGSSNARAIYGGGSNGAVIVDCTIVGNSANEGSGALLLGSCNVRFENCVFQFNRSDQTPPAARGASAVTARGIEFGSPPFVGYALPSVTFTDCEFHDNETFSASSGTVAIEYPQFTPFTSMRPRFERCKFYRNENHEGPRVFPRGGAIAWNLSSVSLRIMTAERYSTCTVLDSQL